MTHKALGISNRLTVSIHTPTKGVTFSEIKHSIMPNVSIHTPTKGVTKLIDFYTKEWVVSIHTPTKGVTSQDLMK